MPVEPAPGNAGRLPLSYSLRNLRARKLSTVMTAGGMALVVFVFAAVMMMSEGIRATLVETGTAGNVVVLRKGAGVEISSAIGRDAAALIGSQAHIAQDPGGLARLSAECVVLNSLPQREGGAPRNVTVRGTSAMGLALRRQVHLAQGRMFRPGTNELVAGRAVARGFAHIGLGQTVHLGGRDWTVVGLLDAGGSGFDSEIWVDADQAMQAFRRSAYSTLLFALDDPRNFETVRRALATDPQLQVDAERETTFYAAQSEQLVRFIRLLGLSLSVIFAIGAVAGAMITMFSAVASRVGEIGTLRALGFRRATVLWSFLGESLALSLAGGVAGTAAALLLGRLQVSTTNFQTFSEMAFRFDMTPAIAASALAFALAMGLIGGMLPAWRASRLSIVACLRAR
jgi:ABC-type lipoprotein release transport system permease subunit